MIVTFGTSPSIKQGSPIQLKANVIKEKGVPDAYAEYADAATENVPAKVNGFFWTL